jgi:hypothetical protein
MILIGAMILNLMYISMMNTHTKKLEEVAHIQKN